ncbi:TetR/AcrR family transcriptional regulator [Bacillus sp. FJAT-47783]|uniref:TetR/AcrR family transcriptional regulator n=1 Tax=Bacillus sp. FJAT-47783 TaxID=2922712 RepID=UPI001FAE01CF|nr:TetR/AcrR family transcriptional regulator [Bacillus sp. FJAT-47783]
MKEKKALILEGAMDLFSKQGFNQTSMQEIADFLGIAKGSIYHYFKSKDQLLIEIIWHYYDVVSEKFYKIERNPILTPKQKFYEQLLLSISVFVENREFIVIHMKESFHFKDDLEAFFRQMRKEIYQWLEQKLFEVYGKDIEPYVLDLATSLQGTAHEYVSHIILDKVEMDLQTLTHHLLHQCDVLVEGYKNYKKRFLKKEMFQLSDKEADFFQEKLKNLLIRAKDLQVQKMVDVIDALLQEWEKAKKERSNYPDIVIESLILHLQTVAEPYWQKEELQELVSLYQQQKSIFH